MLQAIRSKASSLVAKILFGLLVLSFAVWGIGDIFRNRGVDTSIATVGDRKIDVNELKQEVRQDEERWRQRLPRADFQELNRNFHLVDTALQRLINRDLIDLEINRLRIAVGEATVDDLIRTDPAFLDERGNFDPARYRQIVERERMSAPQFKAKLRADLVRQQLNLAVIAGVTPPAELIDALYRRNAERRTAEIATLSPDAVADPGTPSDAEVAAYYQDPDHKDEFAVPPLISFTAALLRVDDVAQTIEVPEDKLREEYQNRLAAYHVDEQRHLQQILLPDEAKANAAAEALAAGKDFAAVAKEVAGAEPDTLDLGFMSKSDLGTSGKLADAAFALKPGEASVPLGDALGWHILRVLAVKPEQTTPFAAVKDELAKDVAREMASDRINAQERKIEDAVAGGAAFADIVQRFDMKTVTIENVDKDGRDRDGQPVEAAAVAAGEMLHQAFATAKGQISPINQLADNAGDYLVRVDNVTEAATKPLEEVKAMVVQRWQQEKRAAALAQLAKDMVGEINGGKKLAELAAARKLASFTSEPLTRAARDPRLSPALVSAIFAAKPGVAVSARGVNGYLVAEVKDILPPDPAQQEKERAAFVDRLVAPAMRDDMLQEFDQALRKRYPVTTDDAAVARAF